VRRSFVLLGALVLALAMLAGPAAAHVLVVDPPGQEEAKGGWVGSPALPEAAQGKGLMPGGPAGAYLQSPSHGKGLNTACEALRANDRSAVDIFGPPTRAGCPHGT
jgi:hypothetical protein